MSNFDNQNSNDLNKGNLNSGTETNPEISDKTVVALNKVTNKTLKDTAVVSSAENADKTVFSNKHKNTSQRKSKISETVSVNDKTQITPRKKVHKKSAKIESGTSEPSANNNNHESMDATRFKAPIKKRPVNDRKALDVEQKTQIKPRNTERAEKAPSENSPSDGIKVLKDRFVLEEVLGIGGMGVVYKAKDLLKVEAQDRDPYVAIKVLSEEFRSHPEAFISLQRESRKTQRIANQNTVKVYDFDRDGDVVFMTMEYMVGQPLDKMVKQYHATGLPRNDAWKILFGMCSALIHSHDENVIHSDLKPGNVYVTENGTAKIFDFGIARAVAKIDRETGKNLDRTVFDAGNLGALTPAYASREMLLGSTPDARDDVYGLGCIAYEILTGEHPFFRLPADEAYNKKLKPKRIPDINKRQWKAIESALAFERKDRVESVGEFYKQLTSKSKAKPILQVVAVILLGVIGFAYLQIMDKPAPQISQDEIRNTIEFEVRYKLFKENIERLLANASFSSEWEVNIWGEVEGVVELLSNEPDEWFLSTRERVYQLYISKIKEATSLSEFERSRHLIDNSFRYTDDPKLLDSEKLILADLLRLQKEKEENDKKLAATKNLQASKNQTRAAATKSKNNLYSVAMANVERQLTCTSSLNMRDFKIAIDKLRSLDNRRYLKSEKQLSKELAKCITSIGKKNPEQASDLKRYALRIFKNNANIVAIVIRPKDGCSPAIAGLGSRGDRAVCRDKLKTGGLGPTLVVIPNNNRVKSFAIGKYEISLAEIQSYCKKVKTCKLNASGNKNLPVTNINISTVKSYLQWLSKETRRKYRLPTKREWIYAAKSSSQNLDSNRNCQLSSRGIQKGGVLIRATTGKQNSWGLINYAGNAQELVYDTGKKLVAVGGSFNTSMESCNIATKTNHSGKPDEYTGFRVARDLAEN